MPAPLVINADDAGFDAEVDACILASARQGLVTSASVVVTGETAADFVAAARALKIGIGLHFNISEGKPLGAAASLRNAAGEFHQPKRVAWQLAAKGAFDHKALADEARLQMKALLELGAEPDHLDSHNHLHCYPEVLDALLDLLGGRRLHVRVPDEPECPPAICPPMPEPRLSSSAMRTRIERAGGFTLSRFVGFAFSREAGERGVAHLDRPVTGGTEWMVHPGQRIGTNFTENPLRRQEAEMLRQADLLAHLRAWGYEPCRFGDLS